ncbi:MAG TPA: hypothetical protein VGK23_12360 [Methanomassiliicoccales archaeon]|jgi:hypothetical protein
MKFSNKAPGDRDGKVSARRKIALTSIIALAIVIMSAGVLMVLSPQGGRINLWFVFPAICAMSACYLASGLIGALNRGKMADSLRNGIQMLTLALLIGLLLIFFPNSPKGATESGLLLILTGFLAMVAYIVKAYSDHYWLIGRAAVIVMLGLTLELGVTMTSTVDLLRGVPLMVAMMVGLLSLLGILHEHSNPFVRAIGRFFHSPSNMIIVTVVLMLLFVYVLKLRDAISKTAPDQTLLGEWIVVAIVVIAVVFKVMSFFRSSEVQQEFCDTRRLVQSIYQDRGDTGYAQSVVDRFVLEGRKEPLVVLLTTVLVQGHADPDRIERVIGGVVRYTVKEQKFTFRWALGNEEAVTKDERTRIAFDALDQTAQVLGAGYLMSERTKPAGIVEG